MSAHGHAGGGAGQDCFDTVLVANRGEIACRILRTVRALGLRGIAVYSDADADAPHLALADEAVRLGPAPARESYLDAERLLAAADASGAGAIHPGYGFLAEDAGFARACEAAGLCFIGPPAAAIEQMGDKAAARRLMTAAGVPCVPGYDEPDASDAELLEAAGTLGYPLMVKAAAGGGGRGLRRIDDAPSLAAALPLARAEARNAFGSDRLILERVIAEARHVEIQVLADRHGHAVHLGERDCSVQRRYQKVIEEAPSPAVDDALRAALGDTALRAAAAVGYTGAGTVEFLLDGDGRFWFLEMNTRLQVEHPVTECVTGLDLVEWQIRIAGGERLPVSQPDARPRGHAIEARLYTEDPAADFRPATGRVALWRAPAGPGLRVDAGVDTGQEIGPWYDALAAKIIAHGPTREIARRRLVAGLRATALLGPATNRGFLIDCLEDPRFVAGTATTAFLAGRPPAPSDPGGAGRLAAAAAVLLYREARAAAAASGPGIDPALLDWPGGVRRPWHLRLEDGNGTLTVSVCPDGAGGYEVAADGRDFVIAVHGLAETDARLSIDGRPVTVALVADGNGGLWLSLGGREARYLPAGRRGGAAAAAGGGRVLAAMHGRVEDVAVRPGDRVAAGQRLVVLEAMKMQQAVDAPLDGVVAAVHVRAGQQVAAGALLLTIEAAAAAGSED